MANPHIGQKKGLPYPLWLFIAISAVLSGISDFRRFRHPLQFPEWPFGYVPDPFRDFYLYKPRYAFFHSPQFFTFQSWPYLYPAPPAVLSWALYRIPNSTTAFLRMIVVGFLIAALLFCRVLIQRGIRPVTAIAYTALVLAFSYPFYIEYQNANLEFLIWIFIGVGLWAWFKEHSYVAAVLFGIAAACKLYPVLLVALLLSRKQYRQMAVALGTAAVTTLVSLWLVCPDIVASYQGVSKGLGIFRKYYMLSYFNGVRADHSLFARVKDAFKILLHHLPSEATLAHALSAYMLVCAVAGLVLYFAVIRFLPLVNQVVCLVVLCITLPPVSYDYTLLQLYAPWFLLVLVAIQRAPARVPGLSACFVCLAVLCSPESDYMFRNQLITGPIKSLALLTLFVLALRYPFPLGLQTSSRVRQLQKVA